MMANENVSPLRDIVVVDLANERAELAGQVLADLGADVIKVEPPGGSASRSRPPFRDDRTDDIEASLYWAAVARGKKSVVLDLETPEGVSAVKRLVQQADILIESFDPGWMAAKGLSYEDLEPANPGLVYASVTPFGQDGPKSDWPATDLTLEAAGGLVSLQGDRDRRPIPLSFPQAAFHGGVQAAADSLVAVWARKSSGRGQHLDVSMQAAVIWILMNATGFPPNVGMDPPGTCDQRDLQLPELAPDLPSPGTIWACADGHVFFAPAISGLGARTFDRLVRWMEEEDGVPEELRGRDWLNWTEDMVEDMRRTIELISSFMRTKTKRELMERATRDALLIAPIYDVPDLVEDAHLNARDYWVEVDGLKRAGPFAKLSATPIVYSAGAPKLGEHQGLLDDAALAARSATSSLSTPSPTVGRPRPFEGLKVADFAWIGAAPMVTKQLADHGATVVHVESSNRPDALRLGQPAKDGIPGINRSQFMANFNSSKLGLALDLTTPGGNKLARELVDWADVVVESFTPGTMAKLGLGWDTLSEGRPDLIMMSSCLRGQTGPNRSFPGGGNSGAAVAGLHHITGWPDRAPHGPWGAYTDFVAPRFSLAALMAALLHRDDTGLGQYIDVSQVEMGMHFMEPLLLDYFANGREAKALGDASLHSCPHGTYPTAGHERYVAVEVQTVDQWRGLCSVVDMGEFATPAFEDVGARRERPKEINQLISHWCRERGPFDAESSLIAAGVPASVVLRPSDLYQDPQLAHRGFFVTCVHTEMGPTPYDGPVTMFSATPAQLTAAPCLGEHTDYVLNDLLGIGTGLAAAYAEEGALV